MSPSEVDRALLRVLLAQLHDRVFDRLFGSVAVEVARNGDDQVLRWDDAVLCVPHRVAAIVPEGGAILFDHPARRVVATLWWCMQLRHRRWAQE